MQAPRTCLIGESAWSRQVVGVAGEGMLGLIYQLVSAYGRDINNSPQRKAAAASPSRLHPLL